MMQLCRSDRVKPALAVEGNGAGIVLGRAEPDRVVTIHACMRESLCEKA